MRIEIITLFPEFFDGFREHSIVGRAIKAGRLEFVVHNLRDQAKDSYGSVDDRPYGGGPGMVLRFDVLLRALRDVKAKLQAPNNKSKTILLTPQGQVYNQRTAYSLQQETNLILICGHYEGFDERIREYVDLEISIGDYVLTGGEIPAMVVVDSVARLLPGVLGDDQSSAKESHSPSTSLGQAGLLEYPQYTRPKEYEGKSVPDILVSGNHADIAKWRRQESIKRTQERRSDLLKNKT